MANLPFHLIRDADWDILFADSQSEDLTKTFQVRKLTCSGKEEPKWQLTALAWLSGGGIHLRKRLRFYEIDLVVDGTRSDIFFHSQQPVVYITRVTRDFYEATSRPRIAAKLGNVRNRGQICEERTCKFDLPSYGFFACFGWNSKLSLYLFVKNFGRLNVVPTRPSSSFRKKRLKTSFRRESCLRCFKTFRYPKILRSWNRKARFLSVVKSTNIFRSIESLSRCFVRQQLSIHLAIITCTFLSSKQPGFASTIGR